LFAIVDIETTGGHAGANRMTEIAILHHDGKKVTNRYHTLINPERSIPPFITQLTGIDEEMITEAPRFFEVASTIESLLKDRVFVAHSVNFDYSFVKYELGRLGISFNPKRLCTIRLCRQIIPGHRAYGLGKICKELNIEIKDRHRALGDAEATAILFSMLVKRDEENFITESLKRNSRESTLPPTLPKQVFQELPEKPGVYFFHNEKGKVIYVGKAINIKKRISGHLTGKESSKKSTRLKFETHNITYTLTGNDLIAQLVESREIKRHWPPHNAVQKITENNYGLFHYTDGLGYMRFAVGKIYKGFKALCSFRSLSEARIFMGEAIQRYELCPKLCGTQKTQKECFNYKLNECHGACCEKESTELYNSRARAFLESLEHSHSSYFIVEAGRQKGEVALVMVERGRYLGYGFLPKEELSSTYEKLISHIEPQKDNQDIQRILNTYVQRHLESDKLNFFPSHQDSAASSQQLLVLQ